MPANTTVSAVNIPYINLKFYTVDEVLIFIAILFDKHSFYF